MRQLFQSDFQHEPDKQAGWIGKVGREFSLLLDQMTLKCCSKTRFLLRSKRLILRKEYKEYSNPIKKATTKGKGTTKQNHNQKKKGSLLKPGQTLHRINIPLIIEACR